MIHEIAIVAPEINYEKGSGGTNLEAIQKNIEGYLKSTGSPHGRKARAPRRLRGGAT